MEMGGWSLDQLMELAGLSVSQAGEYLNHYKAHETQTNLWNQSGDSTPSTQAKKCL